MAEGSSSGFESRVREHHRLVFQVAYSVLRNHADAEDVTQEVFLRAYRQLATLRDPERFRAWVARMSWRMALNRRRGELRARARDDGWFRSRGPETGVEMHAALGEAIARLPEELRDTLLLAAVEGLDTREAAAILEIPEGTVRSRLHTARRRLMEALF